MYNYLAYIINEPPTFVKEKSLPIQDEPEKLGQLVYDWDIRLVVNDGNVQTIEQVKQFLEGSEALEFRSLCVEEKYQPLSTNLEIC